MLTTPNRPSCTPRPNEDKPPRRANVVIVCQGQGGSALGVGIRDDELELAGLRVEGADLSVAPAGHDGPARPRDAYAVALQIWHLQCYI